MILVLAAVCFLIPCNNNASRSFPFYTCDSCPSEFFIFKNGICQIQPVSCPDPLQVYNNMTNKCECSLDSQFIMVSDRCVHRCGEINPVYELGTTECKKCGEYY